MNVQATQAQIDGVRDALEAASTVDHFVFIDKAAALKDFKQRFHSNQDLVNNITAAALPTSFRVVVKRCAELPAFAAAFGHLDGVDSVAPPYHLGRHHPKPPAAATVSVEECRADHRARK
jgi:cell division protein FtsX